MARLAQCRSQRGHVIFPRTKNGDARGVPLHQRVLVALANLPHREGEVFRRPGGLPYERPDDDDEDRGACRRAQIADFHPHDCRHTFATWHYAHNRDLTALMRLGGWKDVKSVIRYMHVNVDELRNTIDRLPGGILGEAIGSEAKTA